MKVLIIFFCLVQVLLCGCANREDKKQNQTNAFDIIFSEDDIDKELLEDYWKNTDADSLVAARANSVRLYVDSLYGSGTIVSLTRDNLRIITAAHLFPNPSCHLTVILDNGSKIETKISIDNAELAENGARLKLREDVDLAIIDIPIDEKVVDLSGVVPCSFNKSIIDNPEYMNIGDYIFLRDLENTNELGYTLGLIEYNYVYVEDFGQYMMIAKGKANPGMSGCGVFDETGELIGVLCGINDDEMLAIIPGAVINMLISE